MSNCWKLKIDRLKPGRMLGLFDWYDMIEGKGDGGMEKLPKKRTLTAAEQQSHDRRLIEESFTGTLLNEKQIKEKFKKYGWK
ncbi:hypothetical protein [Limosilactobacillus kribbianus]|uniref:hypothetical protein n=1 Tax=Limosilactobacillus kribbianus TaxID=2982695 RepID=UPI00226557FE|nr:hypothetical protein [Limosilactobacillus kribbianus]